MSLSCIGSSNSLASMIAITVLIIGGGGAGGGGKGFGRGWKEVSRGCWETAVVSGVKSVEKRLANGWVSESARGIKRKWWAW